MGSDHFVVLRPFLVSRDTVLAYYVIKEAHHFLENLHFDTLNFNRCSLISTKAFSNLDM